MRASFQTRRMGKCSATHHSPDPHRGEDKLRQQPKHRQKRKKVYNCLRLGPKKESSYHEGFTKRHSSETFVHSWLNFLIGGAPTEVVTKVLTQISADIKISLPNLVIYQPTSFKAQPSARIPFYRRSSASKPCLTQCNTHAWHNQRPEITPPTYLTSNAPATGIPGSASPPAAKPCVQKPSPLRRAHKADPAPPPPRPPASPDAHTAHPPAR